MTNDVPIKTTKKIQALAQMAADLRQGKHFEITRLTVLKSLCSDPETAAKFALHLAKLTLKKMKAEKRSSRIELEGRAGSWCQRTHEWVTMLPWTSCSEKSWAGTVGAVEGWRERIHYANEAPDMCQGKRDCLTNWHECSRERQTRRAKWLNVV